MNSLRLNSLRLCVACSYSTKNQQIEKLGHHRSTHGVLTPPWSHASAHSNNHPYFTTNDPITCQMIFNDHTLEDGDGSALHAQRCRRNEFVRGASSTRSCAVLEIGAGVVVSSIRTEAEALGTKGRGLVRINPSEAECDKMEILASKQALRGRYFPVAKRSAEALAGIVEELGA
jgi:hypothetical protein